MVSVDAGKMNESVSVLKLDTVQDGYQWKTNYNLWAKAEVTDKTNLFSRIGLGEKTVIFTVRRCDISLHDGVKWKGKHCFVTDIQQIDRRYLKITTAMVRVSQCTVYNQI